MKAKILKYRDLVFGCAIVLALSCVDEPEGPPSDAIKVGLLLPFTGDDAATGRSYERAALMAKSRYNAAVGKDGRKMYFVIRDTHSDLESATAALQEILDEDVVAVIGPEDAQIARRIIPLMEAANVPLISPVTSGSQTINLASGYKWYRMAPSAWIMGRSFANYLWKNGVVKVVVVYSSGDYHLDFVGAVAARLEELGGERTATVNLQDDVLSYGDQVEAVQAAGTTNIVISAPVETAARFTGEVETTSDQDWSWYLSPALESAVLPQNTYEGILDEALGVGLDVDNADEAFVDAHVAKWSNPPEVGEYYVYDAVMLLGLGALLVEQQDAEVTSVSLAAAIDAVAAKTGAQVPWNEIDIGVEAVVAGGDISYAGLTGSLLFDQLGQQLRAVLKIWTIDDGKIVKYEDF